MRWVEVVDVVVVRAAAVVVVKEAAPWPPDRAATVFVPVVDTRSRTWSDSRATRKNAPSAAYR